MSQTINQQPNLNIGGLSNNGALPRTAGMLSGFSSPTPASPQVPNLIAGQIKGVNQPSTVPSYSGMLSPSTAPPKSTTIKHPDGTTITQTHDNTSGTTGNSTPPTYANGLAPNDSSNQYNTQTGVLNPLYKPPAPVPPTPPAPTPPAPLTVAGQAPNVLTQSNLMNNPYYQGLINKNIQLTQAGTAAGMAGGAFGGQNPLTPTQTAAQGPDYAGLFNPNASPELINAEKNAYSPANAAAIAGNNAGISNLISGAGLATQGAESVLGAVAPQPYGPTTTPYQPGTDTFSGAGGQNRQFTGGENQGNVALGVQYTQMNSAYQQSQVPKNAIQSLLQANPSLIDPTASPYINAVNSWLQNGVISSGPYAQFLNAVNEYTNTITPVLGVGGDATDYRTQIAKSLLNPNASSSTILSELNDPKTGLDAMAQGKLSALKSAGTTGTGGTNSTPINSSVVPGNYTMVNGQWVYNAQ